MLIICINRNQFFSYIYNTHIQRDINNTIDTFHSRISNLKYIFVYLYATAFTFQLYTEYMNITIQKLKHHIQKDLLLYSIL